MPSLEWLLWLKHFVGHLTNMKHFTGVWIFGNLPPRQCWMQDSRICSTCPSVSSSILTGNHGLLNQVNLVDPTRPPRSYWPKEFWGFRGLIGPQGPHRPCTFLDHPTIWFNCSGLGIGVASILFEYFPSKNKCAHCPFAPKGDFRG